MEIARSCSPLRENEGAVLSEDIAIGGQAVIEGVMMRAPRSIATAVRKPDREILVKSDLYVALSRRYKVLNTPILRGAVSFFEMLVIGIRALNFSADVIIAEQEKAEKGPDWERPRSQKFRDRLVLAGVLMFALAAGVGIFFGLPLFLTEIMGLSKNALSFNLVAGIIRVGLFLLYLWGISQWREIKRIFEYHGAEHKSVNAFESGEELSVENLRKYSTHHTRCGTSFLLIVVMLAIFLFAAADTVVEIAIGHRPFVIQRFLTHFSLLPLLAGTSYELLKLSDKKRNSRFMRGLVGPGLWLQRITTREPDDAQLEVAIVALKSALDRSKN
jgi:uncharacterized protein YqhQ